MALPLELVPTRERASASGLVAPVRRFFRKRNLLEDAPERDVLGVFVVVHTTLVERRVRVRAEELSAERARSLVPSAPPRARFTPWASRSAEVLGPPHRCLQCDPRGQATCSPCDGTGSIQLQRDRTVRCSGCDGTGRIRCPTCEGTCSVVNARVTITTHDVSTSAHFITPELDDAVADALSEALLYRARDASLFDPRYAHELESLRALSGNYREAAAVEHYAAYGLDVTRTVRAAQRQLAQLLGSRDLVDHHAVTFVVPVRALHYDDATVVLVDRGSGHASGDRMDCFVLER